MKDEAAFKRHFKKSVSAQGGFSISLAAPMLSGVPDLYVVMPGYTPVLLEAKWMKEITNKTNKQIPLRPMQKNFLDKCNNIHPGVAWVLIGYKFNGAYWAGLFNSEERIMTDRDSVSRISTHSELFDVKRIFELYVPRMNLTYAPVCATMPVETKMGETQDDATTQSLAV